MDQAYFVIIGIFLSVFGTAYTYLSYRNKKRLALINSGLSPDTFKQMAQGKEKRVLVLGLAFIGFSLGIISGFFFEKYLLVPLSPLDLEIGGSKGDSGGVFLGNSTTNGNLWGLFQEH